ncbi:BofC C-terminal domain-containing protein [Paenibacillus timonensis]|uniref:BofC C-terminal domain-containing protein n=2 Tax=Paenibacillus timonensis TaxID=225915 RepID=A0ABW3SBQ7_9BACL|nr:BofC C-terminal domain-containing protein [Paenibacillus timonensis]MCH1640448.1 BofC C-terminal domain-containing protein [Paenibacillus timonensis]
MNIFQIKKHLKKRWRRWRRAIWTASAFCLIAVMAWMGLPLSDQMEKLMAREPMAIETLGKWQEAAPEADEAWLLDLEEDKSRIVHLTKIYTCGEESSVLGIMTPEEIATLMKDHPAWEGRLGAGGDVWIEEKIDGLSDTCKTRGYIGLDRDGNLTLFDGPPKKEKVIRTFFQMDVEMMESALPAEVIQQLQRGIRIQDVEEYNSVLSTFSDFAIEPSERVMQQDEEP